eukprot:TRINITY_DN4914_c0_g2_i3.p4 TRINITY_DN4914_c0_g2~~TRINITY_DN4914_c0_g2_i3.p4  ORF type:complete len:186 (+),score=32.20 TRINITY_DN4914_c0_g2_i3:123-680(+)
MDVGSVLLRDTNRKTTDTEDWLQCISKQDRQARRQAELVMNQVGGELDVQFGSGKEDDCVGVGKAECQADQVAASSTKQMYQEVVRNKKERERLPAHDCADCKRFYAALASWNTIAVDRPSCGHVSKKLSKQELQQIASRHRRKFDIPQTPEGYWKNGFDDTQDREYVKKVRAEILERQQNELNS